MCMCVRAQIDKCGGAGLKVHPSWREGGIFFFFLCAAADMDTHTHSKEGRGAIESSTGYEWFAGTEAGNPRRCQRIKWMRASGHVNGLTR